MNKGFTLVELLGVLVVLAALTLIITISVGRIISDSEDKLSESQKNTIEKAAIHYNLEEGINTNDTCVSVSELISGGYIEGNEVIDPKTKEAITGYVKITYASNQYSYTYQTDSCE